MEVAEQPILLWGKNYQEYIKMFDLSADDLNKKILDIGFGPGSFNAELTAKGGHVVSCHPIYAYSIDEITDLAKKAYHQLEQFIGNSPKQLIWKTFPNPEALLMARQQAQQTFLKDLANALASQRYCTEQLPLLNFAHNQFDIALCANTAFGGGTHGQLDYHFQALKELCRVAHEVRVFPLLTENNEISPLVGPIMAKLFSEDYGVEIKQVDYELQQGGNAMMRVWAKTCDV